MYLKIGKHVHSTPHRTFLGSILNGCVHRAYFFFAVIGFRSGLRAQNGKLPCENDENKSVVVH